MVKKVWYRIKAKRTGHVWRRKLTPREAKDYAIDKLTTVEKAPVKKRFVRRRPTSLWSGFSILR